MILLNNWRIIIGATISGTLLAIVVSFFVMSPVYETSTKLIINIPESILTEMGTYKYPSTVIGDYSEMLVNRAVAEKTITDVDLKMNTEVFVKKLSISKEKESNVVKVSYKGENAEVISKILDMHIANYKEFLQQRLREDAMDKFIKNYQINLKDNERSYKQTQKTIERSEKLLSEMEPVISLRTALARTQI